MRVVAILTALNEVIQSSPVFFSEVQVQMSSLDISSDRDFLMNKEHTTLPVLFRIKKTLSPSVGRVSNVASGI